MTTFNLTQFEGDSIVLHFGGRAPSVNAETFSEVISAFLDLARSVDRITRSEEYELEFVIEALGPGSFRAQIRFIKKSLKKALGLSTVTGVIFWGLVTSAIYDVAKHELLESQTGAVVTVSDAEVVIKNGNDTVIIKREIYNKLPQILTAPMVQENTSKLMRALERDPAVADFGLTAHLSDPVPTLTISRPEILNASQSTDPVTLAEDLTPMTKDEAFVTVTEKTQVRITTAHFKGARKWGFEWGEREISARVTDEVFLAKVKNREYLIGAGDTLDVELTYNKPADAAYGTDIDPKSFIVTKVFWKPELTGADMKSGKDIEPSPLRLKGNIRTKDQP